jgi:ParB family transcriptional regulator, chromosome partitioning protein
MKLEFHQLDRRYEHLRSRDRQGQRRLLASLAASGQQTPIVVVVVADKPDRYQVIDGYKRVAVLEQLGCDTVEAIVWDISEADALVLDRSMRLSEKETALEQGWLLAELEQRFGYSLEDLARRFDRSVSWVSRRLALVEQLPETVQQRVRTGEISAHVAMKYLAPVARANLSDCQRMAEGFSKHRFSSRQAGELYTAWRDASSSMRQRILDSPQLFLKAHQQVSPQPGSAAEELVRDLAMVLAITNRAGRRWARAAPLMGPNELESARRKIECAVKDLTHLAERLEKELEHAEPKPTNNDSGTAQSGGLQTRDRADTGRLTTERAQSPQIELFHLAGAGPARTSRSLPDTNPGTAGVVQRQSSAGP